MKMIIRFVSILAVVICGNAVLALQSVSTNDATKAELNQFLRSLTEAINKSDIQTVLDHCANDVSLTTSDGVACPGKKAIKDYFERMVKSPARRYESFSTSTELEGIALYPGPTVVAFGPCKDHYKMSNGMEFTVDSRWSATLVKEGDRWLVANLHVSCNLFDNPMLGLARQMLAWGAGIAGGGGLLIGMLLGWLLRRRANR
jgi:ketosteroid isomerase-like protein